MKINNFYEVLRENVMIDEMECIVISYNIVFTLKNKKYKMIWKNTDDNIYSKELLEKCLLNEMKECIELLDSGKITNGYLSDYYNYLKTLNLV